MAEPSPSESIYQVHVLGPADSLHGTGGSGGANGSAPERGGADGSNGSSGWHGTSGARGLSLKIAIERGRVSVLESSRATTGAPDVGDLRTRIFIDAAGGNGGSGGRGGAGGDGQRGRDGSDGESATKSNGFRNGRDGGDGGDGGNGGNGGDGGNGSDGGDGGHVVIAAETAADLLALAGVDVSGGRAGHGGAAGAAGCGGRGGQGGAGGRGMIAASTGRRYDDGESGKAGRPGNAGRRGRDGAGGKPGNPGRLEVRIGRGRAAVVSDRVYSGKLSASIADTSRTLAHATSADPRDDSTDTDAPDRATGVATVRAGTRYSISASLSLDGPVPFPVDLEIECAVGDADFTRLATVPSGAGMGRSIPVRGEFTVADDLPEGRHALVIRAVATNGPSLWMLRAGLSLDVRPVVRIAAVRAPREASVLDDDVPVELEVRFLPDAELTPGDSAPRRVVMEAYGSIGPGLPTDFGTAIMARDVAGPGSESVHRLHVKMPASFGFDAAGAAGGDGPDWPCILALRVRFTDPASNRQIMVSQCSVPLRALAPFVLEGELPAPVVGVSSEVFARRRAVRRGMLSYHVTDTGARPAAEPASGRPAGDSHAPTAGPSQSRRVTRVALAAVFDTGDPQALEMSSATSPDDAFRIRLPAELLVGRIRPDGTAPPAPALLMVMHMTGPAGDSRVRIRHRLPAPIIPVPILLHGTFSASLNSPNDLMLEFEHGAGVNPAKEIQAMSVQVRARGSAHAGSHGEWVTATRAPDMPDRMVFAVRMGEGLPVGVPIPLQIRVCIGETAVAAWDAEVARLAPKSRRLKEACLALIGGAVFAQKFAFANPWVAAAGILLTLIVQWPIGAVIGFIEGIALLCMKDSFYLGRLQRPWRWW